MPVEDTSKSERVTRIFVVLTLFHSRVRRKEVVENKIVFCREESEVPQDNRGGMYRVVVEEAVVGTVTEGEELFFSVVKQRLLIG